MSDTENTSTQESQGEEVARLRALVASLREVIAANHQHHIDYDDHGGYGDSELFDLNVGAQFDEHLAPRVAYPPLSDEEVTALSAMVSGAPWAFDYLTALRQAIRTYEHLRIAGRRPVDPADVPTSAPTAAAQPCKGMNCGSTDSKTHSPECEAQYAATICGGRFIPKALPAQDYGKSSREQGLYQKYAVYRMDGTDAPGGKHYDCEYFVLDVTHDPYAIPALTAYEDAAKGTHPQLAADLRARYGL